MITEHLNSATNLKAIELSNTKFISAPLIYAEYYISKEIIDLLTQHGVKEGPADPIEVKECVKRVALGSD